MNSRLRRRDAVGATITREEYSMSKTRETARGRRAFLKRAAVAGGAATVAVAGGKAVAEMTPESSGTRAPEQGSRGYRLTPHIEAYYRSTRS